MSVLRVSEVTVCCDSASCESARNTQVVYLPALEGFEEFDDLPALVSEEFEEAWELPAIPGG